LFFVALFIINIVFAQAYNNPESVVYDPTNDCYYVSNKGDGNIIKVDANNTNTKSYLNTDLSSVRGLCFIGDQLIAAADEGVVFISLPGGAINKTVPIVGMVFLNDVTWDNTEVIFISDPGAGKIYKLIISDNYSYETLADGLTSPNGLYWDGDNSRLIFVPMINNAPIMAVNMGDRTVSQIRQTSLHQPDGITRDMFGNYYISYWGQNSVYRFTGDFSGDSKLVSSQHSGPADIFFRELTSTGKVKNSTESKSNTGILVVPNFNSHTVEFIELTELTSSDVNYSIPEDFQLHQNFPNPFNPTTTIFYDVSKESNVKISVFDLLGREIVTLVDQIEPVGNRSINWDGRDYTGSLVNSGVYIYQVEAEGFLQTKKMVLLK
jgi:sugar lactone lactonase YvrE